MRASMRMNQMRMKLQRTARAGRRSEEHTSELQSRQYLVCRLLLEKKKKSIKHTYCLLTLYYINSYYHIQSSYTTQRTHLRHFFTPTDQPLRRLLYDCHNIIPSYSQ